MVRRVLLRLLLFVVSLVLGLTGAIVTEAATNGAADGTYTVTVTRLRVCETGTTNCTEVFSGSQAINIAGVGAGAVAAGLVTGAELPAGTYTSVEVTTDATLTVKGYVNISGVTHYTDGGTDATAFNNAAGNDQFNQSDYTTSTFTMPADARTSTDTGLTITVGPGLSAPKVRVTFDTSGVFINDGGNPSLGPPTVTMTVN